MKALIRNKGETVTEDMKVFDIDWGTGAPLTNEAWAGGPYTLVVDYVPPEPVEGYDEPQPVQCTRSSESEGAVTESPSTPVEEKPAEQPSEALPETVTYGGKEYTLEELKKLIG